MLQCAAQNRSNFHCDFIVFSSEFAGENAFPPTFCIETAMSPKQNAEQNAADKKLQAKIIELQGKKHLPEEMTALAAEVARLQGESMAKVAFNAKPGQLPAAVMQKLSPPEKRFSGLPILPGRDFPLDMNSIRSLAGAVLDRIPTAAPTLAELAGELRAALAADPEKLEAASREILDAEQDREALPCLGVWAKEHPEAPHFFRFVVSSAAMPSLVAAGAILGKEHDREKVWPHGHCPVCGNQPLIGRLEGKEGRRMHTCSFCSYEFRAPRLGCPFCLAPETEGSEYYVSEDEPGYILNVCDSCKNYFKLGDFRELDRPWLPLLDDLGSLTLDLYAVQMGYKRPTLSGWGF